MKKPYLLAVLAVTGLTILLSAFDAAAQQPATGGRPMAPAARGMPVTPQAGPPVALLDVNFVFRNHTRFKGMKDAMKADLLAFQNQVKAEQEAIRKLIEDLRSLPPGSAEYKSREEAITNRKATLAVQAELQKKEFMQREAKIYYRVYQEIRYEVENFARNNGIGMVVSFSREVPNPDQPETVLRAVNRPVIWNAPQLDITDVILRGLEGPRPDPRVGVETRPRPGVGGIQRR